MIYVGTTGAQRGQAAGVLAAVAVVLGGVGYTLLTVGGVSAAMIANPAVFNVIRILGIVFLVYLGVKLLVLAFDSTPPAPVAHASGKAFRDGLIISLTNPQLAIFFLGFLPQFVSPFGPPVWRQLLLLGLTFNCCSLLVNISNAMLTGYLHRANLGGVRFRQVMRGIAGTAFVLLAVRSALALLK